MNIRINYYSKKKTITYYSCSSVKVSSDYLTFIDVYCNRVEINLHDSDLSGFSISFNG